MKKNAQEYLPSLLSALSEQYHLPFKRVELIESRIRNNKTDIPIRLIKNGHNSGSVFAQWQKAFQAATGDYVWIAEADDSCSPYFLENIMPAFKDNTMVISYCESLTIDEKNRLFAKVIRLAISMVTRLRVYIRTKTTGTISSPASTKKTPGTT